MTLPPLGAYSNLTDGFKDTKMALGRRGYSLRSRRDTIQEGLGALERSREKGIRLRKKSSKSKKKKSSTGRKLKPKTLSAKLKLK